MLWSGWLLEKLMARDSSKSAPSLRNEVALLVSAEPCSRAPPVLARGQGGLVALGGPMCSWFMSGVMGPAMQQ